MAVHARVGPGGRRARYPFAEMHHDLPSPGLRVLGNPLAATPLIWTSRGTSDFDELINDQQSMVTSSAISTLCQPRNFSAVAWRYISHPRHFS